MSTGSRESVLKKFSNTPCFVCGTKWASRWTKSSRFPDKELAACFGKAARGVMCHACSSAVYHHRRSGRRKTFIHMLDCRRYEQSPHGPGRPPVAAGHASSASGKQHERAYQLPSKAPRPFSTKRSPAKSRSLGLLQHNEPGPARYSLAPVSGYVTHRSKNDMRQPAYHDHDRSLPTYTSSYVPYQSWNSQDSELTETVFINSEESQSSVKNFGVRTSSDTSYSPGLRDKRRDFQNNAMNEDEDVSYSDSTVSNLVVRLPSGHLLQADLLSKPIRQWTTNDCACALVLNGFTEEAGMFTEHEMDGETLFLATVEHLIEFVGLKLGPALKVAAFLEKLIESHRPRR